MGTSRSFAELATKLEAAARKIETQGDREVLVANAVKAKAIITAHIRQVVPDMRLNGRKGDNSAPLRVYDRELKGTGATTAARLVAVKGPLQLVERDTAAHSIPKGDGGTLTHTRTGRKRSAKSRAKREAEATKVYRIGKAYVRGPIKHPGTKGQHPFERGVKKFLPSVGNTFERGVDRIIREVF